MNMNMKPAMPMPNGLKTTLALGATAIGAATSHATVVYLDTAGKNLTVTSIENVDSNETLNFYYDSASHEIGIGGVYGNGGNRGIQIEAKGKTGGGNDLSVSYIGYLGSPPNLYYTSTVEGGGANPYTVGSIIGAGCNFEPSDHGVSFGLYGGIDTYVGIRVWNGDTDGLYNYGWAKLTTPDGLSVTLKELAFETEINTPITITSSAVPEPGSLVSLSVLLSSAAFLRTRRKTAAA
jgi:hypothetical protein